MMSDIKEDIPDFVKVDVKNEVNWENAFLPENEHPVCESIDSMVDDYSRFKVKIEFEHIDYDKQNTDSLNEVNTAYANFKCKEEIKDEGEYEPCNTFITENQEFSEKREFDEIDESKTILQSNHYTYKHEKENDSQNEKAFTQRNTPDDDYEEKNGPSTMDSNSILVKKEKTKNCQFCNTFFRTKRSLDDHLLTHHNQEIEGDLKSIITSKIHTCNICNSYETTYKNKIDRHVNSVHNGVKFKMKCQFCTKSFSDKPSLDGHVLRNHKDKIKTNFKSFITSKIHICKMCNTFETTRKSNLDQHINSVHNEEKIKLKCQFCTESFIDKRSLDGHVLRKHKDEIKNNFKSFITSKIHVCEICNSFETTVKSNLDQHINTVHNEAKVKMKCQFCTKSFFFKNSLDGHVLRKHKDKIKNNFKSFITSKIYACKICNSYETTVKSNFNQHNNSVHKEVKVKIKCEFCTKSFFCKRSLDGHVLKKHKDEMKNNE